MANDINFYYIKDISSIPENITNGNIYFILDENKKIANLKVDLDDNRYTVNPDIPLATDELNGLISKQDKIKLDFVNIYKDSNTTHTDVSTKDGSFFKFLNKIFIEDSEVLTSNSIKSVLVHSIGPEEADQTDRVNIIPTDDGSYVLQLNLKIPEGPMGLTGPQGKKSTIGNINISIENDGGNAEGSAEVVSQIERETEVIHNLQLNLKNIKGETGDKGDQGDVGPIGPVGPQGKVAGIKFQFESGDTFSQDITPILDEDGNDTGDTKVHVIIPKGEKGEPGKGFKFSKIFSSIEDMEEANKVTDPENENYIPLNSFILISKRGTDSDEQIGYVYFKDDVKHEDSNDSLHYIVDMSPTQPIFTIEKTNTLAPNEPAFVTIDNNDNIAKPKLTFNIPQGKPLSDAEVSASVNNDIGDPYVDSDIDMEEQDDGSYKMNLRLDFQNLGVITPIEIGDISVINSDVDKSPEIFITPRVNEETKAQILDFVFTNIKGQKGDASDSFDTSDTGISAEYHEDNGGRRAQVSAYTENGKIQLKFDFYNLKGEDGSVKAIQIIGNGPAVSNIGLSNNNLIVHKDENIATKSFASNADNLYSGVVKVERGGTGLQSIPQNAVLIGQGQSPLFPMTSPASGGAFFASSGTNPPMFGTLPVHLGGTGLTSLPTNSILYSRTGNAIQGIVIDSNGAFYKPSYSSTPIFGTLPVIYGGTGNTAFTENSVLLGNNTETLEETQSNIGVLYSTGINQKPSFGILPVKYGGVGSNNPEDPNAEITAQQARVNIGATHTILTDSNDYLGTYQLILENVVDNTLKLEIQPENP